ncbi:hypothetical protein G7Y79_00058g091320 [Physcia stellaris]|nr:hypothetical protein G7Y79_00058g091320 [Physcia stellaris]
MRSAIASPQAPSTTTWFLIMINAVPLILTSPSHTSAAPITTLDLSRQPPFISHLAPAPRLSTSTSPTHVFHARHNSHSNTSLPFPLHDTTPSPFPEKDQQEADYISSGQYPAENGPEAEKSAAAQPKMIAVYVVVGVAMLVLGFCVYKALRYRSKHEGFWW